MGKIQKNFVRNVTTSLRFWMNAKSTVHLDLMNIHIQMEGKPAVNALISLMSKSMEIQQDVSVLLMHTSLQESVLIDKNNKESKYFLLK